jgi:hypothetical protein
MLTSPVLLDLAHDTRQRIAVGASGVICRILSLVVRTTSDNPAIPRLAIVTAFAQSLDLLEYWVDLISTSTREVKRASKQKRKMTVAGEPHERKLSVACEVTRTAHGLA